MAIPLAPSEVMEPLAVMPEGIVNEYHSPSSSLSMPAVISVPPGKVTLLVSCSPVPYTVTFSCACGSVLLMREILGAAERISKVYSSSAPDFTRRILLRTSSGAFTTGVLLSTVISMELSATYATLKKVS